MAGALDVWTVYDDLEWDPHPGQEEVVSNPARNRLVAAGRRWGKSDVGGHELVPEALLTYGQQHTLKSMGKRREFWVVGPEYSDSEKEFRVLYNNLSKLEVPFDRPGTYNDPLGGNMHISLWNGTFQVHAKSAKHPETLVGEGLHGVILSEAAKLKASVWFKYIRPTLADFDGWSLMTSTPEGKNWFYDMWKIGQDPKRPDWMSWRYPAWRNPYVYKTPTSTEHVKRMQSLLDNDRAGLGLFALRETFGLEIDDEIMGMLGDLTPESFNQEIGADFTEFVGRVFKEFDEENHVYDLAWEPGWDTVAAVDYGFTNPNVWLLIQVGPWGQVHVFDELYEPGLTATEFAEEIAGRGLGNVRTFYPDPASPGDTRQLENILKVRATGHTGGELKYRIDAIRAALKRVPRLADDDNPDKKPQLKINRRCVRTISDMLEYRYPQIRSEQNKDNNSPENPLKKDDHAPEALGRFMRGYFGTPDQQAATIRKRPADIRRGGKREGSTGRLRHIENAARQVNPTR